MQGLKQFSIPYKGLNFDVYNYSFEVNQQFFNAFEDSPLKNGNLKKLIKPIYGTTNKEQCFNGFQMKKLFLTNFTKIKLPQK